MDSVRKLLDTPSYSGKTNNYSVTLKPVFCTRGIHKRFMIYPVKQSFYPLFCLGYGTLGMYSDAKKRREKYRLGYLEIGEKIILKQIL